MGYYHIKNIKIDKKNNKISAELADSNLEPIEFYPVDDLSDKTSFKEKYATFIYNLVAGNFHPYQNNKYSKIVMHHLLENYYDDVRNIGMLDTYYKYKDVVAGIMNNDSTKYIMLESDRELNPQEYYDLKSIEITTEHKGQYYTNNKNELYLYNNEKGLLKCDNSKKNYGYPFGTPRDIEKFKEYNDFLVSKLDVSIKEWYLKNYPEDEEGNDLNDNISFRDINNLLDKNVDSAFYSSIGIVPNMIIRKRLFTELANILEVNYDDLNYKWLSQDKEINEQCLPFKFEYIFLGRLKSDCEYFLGHGHRYEKHLWAGNVEDQIKEMKNTWNKFLEDLKPEWLTFKQIEKYEKAMLANDNVDEENIEIGM